MKRTFFIAALLVPMMIMAQTKNFLDVPYLETSAKVEAVVEPDRIYLNISIREVDSKGKVSLEKKENQMVAELKKLDINIDEQLTILDLGSNFKKYFLKQKDVLKSRSYRLLVYDGLTASKVLLALERVGIANVSLGKTEYSKKEQLLLDLKGLAVAKAKEKALAMIKPLGQNLGPAIHIVENSAPSWQARSIGANSLVEYDAASSLPADIGFEKIKFESSVNVKFKLLSN